MRLRDANLRLSWSEELKVYIRDSLNDTGITPSAGTLYMSPDIIVRNELLANPEVALQDMPSV